MKRVNIHELPSFATEEEEARFWQEHELDDESLDAMRPPGWIEMIRNPVHRSAFKAGIESLIYPWWWIFVMLAALLYGIGTALFDWPG